MSVFANNTPYAALDLPMTDPTGRDVLVVVVKLTFSVDPSGNVRLAGEQAPVRINDELYEQDGAESSVRLPTDAVTEKLGTDVIVVGDAIAPKPVSVLDVAVKVDARTIPLRVHGERFFKRAINGMTITRAAPFVRQPIVYELAYGGVGEDAFTVEKRNRAGRGVAKDVSVLDGTKAPQIEHPARPHTSAADRHPPVGYGAIRSHWSPRLEYAGTFDDVWTETRIPLMPVDFDVRANNAAHPTLRFDEGLSPGAQISVVNMTEEGGFAFTLPPVDVAIVGRTDARRVEIVPSIDTLVIEPEAHRFELTLRGRLPRGRAHDVLREARVERR